MLCRLRSDCWIRHLTGLNRARTGRKQQTRVGSCIDLEKFLSRRRRRRSVRSGSEATMAGGGGISWSAVLLHLDG
uniref:Uncharacterized protein n=1 Tax=Zea mays TaxID=4577 RepID=B6UBY4_MAIZE|nr:hypothetical protein [Zea mays]